MGMEKTNDRLYSFTAHQLLTKIMEDTMGGGAGGFKMFNNDLHSAHSLRPSSTQPQPSLTVQNTICGSAHSCSPDDGHNDARNMLT